jgi:hypothetical protein
MRKIYACPSCEAKDLLIAQLEQDLIKLEELHSACKDREDYFWNGIHAAGVVQAQDKRIHDALAALEEK